MRIMVLQWYYSPLIELLRRLNELKPVNHIKQCLANSMIFSGISGILHIEELVKARAGTRERLLQHPQDKI